MEQELAYSFYLGSDKNKSKLAKRVSKDNVFGTTSLSNDDENEIANNITRKVRPKEQLKDKSKKKNNYELK